MTAKLENLVITPEYLQMKKIEDRLEYLVDQGIKFKAAKEYLESQKKISEFDLPALVRVFKKGGTKKEMIAEAVKVSGYSESTVIHHYSFIEFAKEWANQ